MKHRTVSIFIVVLAFMAVLPQGYQQLSALKEAAGNRLNAGIWNAFLNLNGKKGGSAPRKLEPVKALETELASKTNNASEKSRGETEPAKEVGERSTRQSRAKSAQEQFVAEESEIELAQLGELERFIDLDSISKGRVVLRVPEVLALKEEAGARALVIEEREAEKFAREYQRTLEGVRRGELRKAQKTLPKAAAQTYERTTILKDAKTENRWLWEGSNMHLQLNNGTTTNFKSNAQECEATN